MKIFKFVRAFLHELTALKVKVTVPVVPLVANCGTPMMNHSMSEAMTRSYAYTPIMDFGSMLTKFEKKLWVYNVSRVDHKFDHPMLRNVTIPANTTNKRYSLWTSFPEVVMGINYNIDTNETVPNMIKGEYFVDDLINPACHEGSGLPKSMGSDLSVRGVFWSYSNPPKPSEVNVAAKKMKDFYADLLEKVKVLEEDAAHRNNPDWITPEHHAAAEYFKVITPWHKR